MCWVIGGLFSTGVLTGLMKNTSQWGYRIPFALQWIWPVPIIIVTLLAPESPWWLVRQGRVEDARAAIAKLTTPQEGIEFDLDAHVEMTVVTDQFEKEVSAGTNYWHLFRGSDLHRTEVSAMAFITQALCGVPFMGFGTQFFRSVGLSQDDAFHLTIGQDCLGLVGCFIAWWIMTNFGRRKMYLTGLSVITLILLIVGFIGLAPKSNDSASLAGGVMIILMIFCFQVDPVFIYVNHMLTNLAFYRTHLLYTSRRNSQLSPPCQDRRPVARQLQQHRVCYKHDHAEDGGCERLELGCEGRILLGWYCSFVHRLGIFPSPRDQGTHIFRVGSAL
jgi:MFS family permease